MDGVLFSVSSLMSLWIAVIYLLNIFCVYILRGPSEANFDSNKKKFQILNTWSSIICNDLMHFGYFSTVNTIFIPGLVSLQKSMNYVTRDCTNKWNCLAENDVEKYAWFMTIIKESYRWILNIIKINRISNYIYDCRIFLNNMTFTPLSI